MNKQELIDKAVEDLKGLHGLSENNLGLINNCRNTFLVGYEEDRYSWAHPQSIAARGKTEAIAIGEYSHLVQRARELGWINGYRWGAEYPTNGKKPDLPDDVLVKVKVVCNIWGDAIPARRITIDETDFSAAAFRIVDERYKPIELEKPEQKTELSWHERGELPPVGVECEVYFHKWLVCYFLGVTRKGNPIVEWGNGYAESLMADTKFRPIKSERDLFVEAALKVVAVGNLSRTKEIAEKLYDAGFRAPE